MSSWSRRLVGGLSGRSREDEGVRMSLRRLSISADYNIDDVDDVKGSTSPVLSEVPAIFSSSSAGDRSGRRQMESGAIRVRRFVVNDTECTVQSAGSSEHGGVAVEVGDDNGSGSGSGSGSAKTAGEYDDEELYEERMRGSASACTLSLSDGSEVLIITNAWPHSDEPNILCVSASVSPSDSSVSFSTNKIELDLSSSCSYFDFPVAVKCFADDTQHDGQLIRMIMIDTAGIIFTLTFSLDSTTTELMPTSNIQVHSIPNLIQRTQNPDLDSSSTSSQLPLYPHPGAMLHSASVAFLSSTRIVVALSPYLLAVDLATHQILQWSQKHCIQRQSRRSTIGNIFSKAGGILIGHTPTAEQHHLADNSYFDTQDMPPTAALCVVQSTPKQNTEHYSRTQQDYNHHHHEDEYGVKCLFSIHADGSVRMWSVSSRSMFPIGMRKIRVSSSVLNIGNDHEPNNNGQTNQSDMYRNDDDNDQEEGDSDIPTERLADPPLPHPSTWSTSNDSVLMTGRLYRSNDSLYALAIHVRTDEAFVATSTLAGEEHDKGLISSSSSRNCHLIVLHGEADCTYSGIDEGPDEVVKMNVPTQTNKVMDMQFVPTGKRCSLQLLLLQQTLHGKAMKVAIYNSSHVAMIHSHPMQYKAEYTIDYVAEEERKAILALSTSVLETLHDTVDEEESHTFEQELHNMNVTYMKWLFRPSHPRGFGSLESEGGTKLAPSSRCVRRALYKLIPNYRPNMKQSVEQETLAAMTEWVRIDERRELASASMKSGEGSVMEDDEGGHMERGYFDVDEVDDTPQQLRRQCHRKLGAHNARWTKLLLKVWEEECKLRSPLCLVPLSSLPTAVPSSTTDGADVVATAMVIRACVSTAIIVTSPIMQTTGEPTTTTHTASDTSEKLDAVALSLLRHINTHKDKNQILNTVEHKVWDIVSRALLITGKQYIMERLVEHLGVLGSWSLSSTSLSSQEEEMDLPTGMQIAQLLQTMSEDDIKSWSDDSSPLSSLSGSLASYLPPGLPFVDATADRTGKTDTSNLMNVQSSSSNDDDVRASASFLTMQYLDSIKRLHLARTVMLLGIMRVHADSSSKVVDVDKITIRRFLHTVAVMWVCSQTIPNSRAALPSSLRSIASRTATVISGVGEPTSSPPGSRPRYSDDGAVVTTKTTVLDSNLSQLEALASPLMSAVGGGKQTLTSHVFRPALGLAQMFILTSLAIHDGNGNAYVLPELGLLPRPSSSIDNMTSAMKTEHPRLALRLLAPFFAYPSLSEEDALARSRRELIAECLLIECAHASRNMTMDEDKVVDLRGVASNLLRDDLAFEEDNVHCGTAEMNEVGFDLLIQLKRSGSGRLSNVPMTTQQRGGQQTMPENALANLLQRLIRDMNSNTTGSVGGDIERLCKLPTVRSLFLPWISECTSVSADADPMMHMSRKLSTTSDERVLTLNVDPMYLVQQAGRSLLVISNLMHRVAVLERHLGSVGTESSCDLILASIRDVIKAIQCAMSAKKYRGISEYATLWSSLFRHAMAGRKWSDAYEACIANPILQRQIKNYRRLVIGMVDAGALGELLDLCAMVGASSNGEDSSGGNVEEPEMGESMETDIGGDVSQGAVTNKKECVDLYEIAAEMLAEAAYEQSRRGGLYYYEATALASSSAARGTASTAPTDYRACLYALHASRGHWRRAAQAMDMTCGIATAAGNVAASSTSSTNVALEKHIMDDISLSSLGCANAIALVENPAHRYLVRGELGPYSIPAVFYDADHGDSTESESVGGNHSLSSRMSIKRSRGGGLVDRVSPSSSSSQDVESTDRLSRFMNETDIRHRAARATALRTLHMDGSTTSSLSSLLNTTQKLSSAESDRVIIDALASLGYYRHAIAVASSLKSINPGSRPGGRDVFYDAVSYVLCAYLAPTMVMCSRSPPQNAAGDVCDTMDGGDCPNETNLVSSLTRPTLAQLRWVAEAELPEWRDSVYSVVPESWKLRKSMYDAARGKIAADLLRTYTLLYSNMNNRIALEVAGTFLDLDEGRANLPRWLIDLLIGAQSSGSIRAGDCDFGSDPSGLFANMSRGDTVAVRSAADPAGLLRLYMQRGLYVEACDIVESVLLGLGKDVSGESSRIKAAPSRLPEKGSIDYVPYNTIDMLWKLMEAACSAAMISEQEKKKMLNARKKMENALERHFEVMKISEIGMRSARALNVASGERLLRILELGND